MNSLPPLDLTLQRCRIRPWRRGDEPSLATHADNRSVWRNLRDRFPHPYTLEDARAWVERCEGAVVPTAWAIVIDGEAVGGIGLLPGTDVHRLSAEIGFWLGERHWGCGVMTEAVSAVTRAAFERFDFERIHADVFEWNAASMRVLEKCGYEREGRQRRAVFKDGRFADVIVHVKLRPQAPARSGSGGS